MMQDDRTTQGFGFGVKQITRRDAIKAGGIAAVGLAFSKPLIESIYPKSAFADYVTEPPLTTQFCGDAFHTGPSSHAVAIGLKLVATSSLANTQGGKAKADPLASTLIDGELCKIDVFGKDSAVYFTGTRVVGAGVTFFSDKGGSEMKTELFVEISDPVTGDLKQKVEFHISCSRDLSLQDQFGHLVVVGWTGIDGRDFGEQP